MSVPRDPRPAAESAANDNEPRGCLKADVRLPKAMPVQLVEVEVLLELLESLPPIANDNEDGGE